MSAQEFDELLKRFKLLWVELEGRPFTLKWHDVVEVAIFEGQPIGRTKIKAWTETAGDDPPFDLDAREVIGRVNLPTDEFGAGFTFCLDVLTLPKHESFAHARQTFVELSSRAGAALPLTIREELERYVFPLNSDPAACWYAVLFRMHGEIAVDREGEPRKMVTLAQPVRSSIDAIEKLNLNSPKVTRPVEGAGEIDSEPDVGKTPPTKTKRSTQRGEGEAKLISALTKHHKFADGGCLNWDPIGNNELARQADVSPSTAWEFIKKRFGGRKNYRASCKTERLIGFLKRLNQEYSLDDLYGARPPGEDERQDEE